MGTCQRKQFCMQGLETVWKASLGKWSLSFRQGYSHTLYQPWAAFMGKLKEACWWCNGMLFSKAFPKLQLSQMDGPCCQLYFQCVSSDTRNLITAWQIAAFSARSGVKKIFHSKKPLVKLWKALVIIRCWADPRFVSPTDSHIHLLWEWENYRPRGGCSLTPGYCNVLYSCRPIFRVDDEIWLFTKEKYRQVQGHKLKLDRIWSKYCSPKNSFSRNIWHVYGLALKVEVLDIARFTTIYFPLHSFQEK